MFLAVEVGNKPALCAWVSASVLSLIVAPYRYPAIMFALFFGYYPLIKQKLEKLPSRLAEYACKLLLFSASAVVGLFIFVFVFGVTEALEGVGELTGFDPLLILIAGNIVVGSAMFICYDILLTRCYAMYISRYRQKLFGGAKWGG